MAANGTTSTSQSQIPNFRGEKYHLWSLKMKTMFKSQELWDLVENGFTEPNPAPAVPDQQLRENRKKDAKALFFIQSAIEDDIFSRISAANTAHEAWEILKQEYLGDQKVIKVRLQTLRRSFAELMMGEKETVQNYLSRVTEIVSQMGSYGETISNEQVVGKVLRSLNESFDYLVPAIEESKDPSTYTFDELMSSLLAHETREAVVEADFAVDFVAEVMAVVEDEDVMMRDVKTNMVFNAIITRRMDTKKLSVGSSRSMTKSKFHRKSGRGKQSILDTLKYLDEKQKGEVRLGDDKQVPIEGRGTVAIKTIQGDVKLIHDVQYVPSLAHSLLSVGQLMASGYSIVFNNKTCAIADKKSGHTIALIRMTQNRMFPLDVSNDVGSALVAKSENETRLWHFRYGHLNVKSLRVLSQNEMVVGLPKIGEHVFCEGCIWNTSEAFPFTPKYLQDM
ncbi:hypothetical protein SASPL_135439 [Salvia splendens]|uniref:GAG-pre-integrase domain-containing protein n=1 Tax=Salvia splendens TaxID=180675 RepID=A0A8X8WYR2_SALSN|nr:hypothetical protein SASPL_135439 [Salvia splendens]